MNRMSAGRTILTGGGGDRCARVGDYFATVATVPPVNVVQ
jgi:hypothetical protein